MNEMMNTVGRMAYNRSLGLLLIRIALGVVFITHGWMKVQNMEMTTGFFVGMGLPAWTAMFIAWLEVIGGAALILGVYTRIFAFIFSIQMMFAIYFTGFFAEGYSAHEFEVVLMLGTLGLALAGSGRYSLWSGDCHHCGGMKCNDGHDTKPMPL